MSLTFHAKTMFDVNDRYLCLGSPFDRFFHTQHLRFIDFLRRIEYTHIVNPGASRTLLLVHGWPSLWSSWSNQILHFGVSVIIRLNPLLRPHAFLRFVLNL